MRRQLAFTADTRGRLARIGAATAIMAATLAVTLAVLAIAVGRPESILGQTVVLAVLIGVAAITGMTFLGRTTSNKMNNIGLAVGT